MDITKQHQDQQEAKQLQSRISSFFVDFRIGTLLNKSGIRKLRGVSPMTLFSVIFMLPFAGNNFFRGIKYGLRLGSCDEMAARLMPYASIHRVFLYGKYRDVNAFSKTVMLKTLKCPVRVVWVYRKTQWIALFSTDMDLSVKQVIEYYGARWKIESGFKEIKQDIGSSKSQARNAHVRD